MITYAVGDVHGCSDLLQSALKVIARHARGKAYELVFLGDYIDRGPDSRGVIEMLMLPRNEGRVVCLKGNHEALLVDHAIRGRSGAAWRALGGDATLRSYGSDRDGAHPTALPMAHLQWMLRRPTFYLSNGRIFVHAGIDPRKSFDVQGDREFLWIREAFLTANPQSFVERRHVVHGHTPVWAGKPQARQPELLSHRTNLDTGAFLTGVLTIGVFTEDGSGPREILTA